MQEHPAIGESILKKVDLYADVALIVRHHHERIDGKATQTNPRRQDPTAVKDHRRCGCLQRDDIQSTLSGGYAEPGSAAGWPRQ